MCHEFYFVCPAKLIAVEELPENVGLLWTAGTKLVTKRKAVRREPDPVALVSLMSYVLMSRCRVVGDMWEAARRDPRAEWRAWLDQRAEDQRLGREVSERIKRIVAEARTARTRAESERDRLNGVRELLIELGLEDAGAYELRQRLTGGKQAANLEHIKRMADAIARACNGAA